jgi:lincosamide nucleotidyltransferase
MPDGVRRRVEVPLPTPAQLLSRLDAIASSLQERSDALGLLALGSVGLELSRLDEHSDLDFFVIVPPGSRDRYLEDLAWLERVHPLAYSFRNEADSHKVLFEDGVYAEFAVVELPDLEGMFFSPGRFVWKREGVDGALASPARTDSSRTRRPLEGFVGEALTNLLVGLHREARGERLTATRFIQGYAVDRVLDIAELLLEPTSAVRDRFGAERRFEERYPAVAATLPGMMPGYGGNRSAALSILAWLESHAEVHPRMAREIRALCQGESDG